MHLFLMFPRLLLALTLSQAFLICNMLFFKMSIMGVFCSMLLHQSFSGVSRA